jgi:hypothetical protein
VLPSRGRLCGGELIADAGTERGRGATACGGPRDERGYFHAVTGAGCAVDTTVSASSAASSAAGVRGRPSVAAAASCHARAEPLGARQQTAGTDPRERADGPATGCGLSAACRVAAARRCQSGADYRAITRHAKSGSGSAATLRRDARLHVPRDSASRDQGDRRTH